MIGQVRDGERADAHVVAGQVVREPREDAGPVLEEHRELRRHLHGVGAPVAGGVVFCKRFPTSALPEGEQTATGDSFSTGFSLGRSASSIGVGRAMKESSTR